MPGEWDIAGSFIQGIMARRQQDQQREANEELIKKAKAENTLIDLQAKAAQRKAALFEKYTGGGVPQQGAPAPTQMGQPQTMTAPTEVAGPQEVGGFTMPQQKQGIAQTIAQGQLQGTPAGQVKGQGVDPELESLLPMLGQLSERKQIMDAFGIDDPTVAKEYIKSIVNPETGGPQTLAVGPTGKVLRAFDEFRFPKDYVRTTEEGGKEVWQMQPGTTFEGGGLKGVIPLSSATAKENQKDIKWTDEAGTKWEMTVNATTSQPIPNVSVPRRVGQETISEGKESSKSMFSANLAAASKRASNLAKNLFTLDDNGKLALTVSGRLQGTFPKISQMLGGEIINDATQITYALLRPESGAAINEGELQVKLGTVLPKLMTEPEYAKENFLTMGTVIDEYLSSIDPGYKPQARTIMEEALPGAKKRPSLKMRKDKGKDYDMEYKPGQGIIR